MTNEVASIESSEQTGAATMTEVQKLENGFNVASAELARIESENMPLIAAAVAASDWPAITKLGEQREAAKTRLDAAKAVLDAATKKSKWETLVGIREPVVNSLRQDLIDAKLFAPVSAVRGIIKIETVLVKTMIDGSEQDIPTRVANVTLTPVIEKLDLTDASKLVAAAVDVEAFHAEGIDSIEINVTNIGKSDAMVNIMPTSATSAAARVKTPAAATSTTATKESTGGTRSGALEYEYKGEWMSAKGFLAAVRESGETIATSRKQGFETALDGTGNGLSNLAKQVAHELKVESRTRAEE